jgi:hypothetical protein
LIVRDGSAETDVALERLSDMHIQAFGRFDDHGRFITPDGDSLVAIDDELRHILERLTATSPHAVRFGDLSASPGAARDLFTAHVHGLLNLVDTAPPFAFPPDPRPRAPKHVRRRAEDAARSGAASAIVVSAWHRALRLSTDDCALLARCDGKTFLDGPGVIELARKGLFLP